MADKEINYTKAVDYWSNVSTDENGVLGGFGLQTAVPKVDASGSIAFVERLQSLSPNTFPNGPLDATQPKIVLDVGAGIGRVSRDVISKFAPAVDILEPAGPLIEKAREIQDIVHVNKFFQMGIQDFDFPTDYKYWCIWCQWCVGQVPDAVLVDFLKKCKENLQEGGIIIVKENNSTSDEDIFDDVDSSVTRTHEKFKSLFAQAGLRLLLSSLQRGLPKDLFPVRLYALAPTVQKEEVQVNYI